MGKLLAAILVLTSSPLWGETWREINRGLPTVVAGAGGITIDPSNPATLYTWGGKALLKSIDGGANGNRISGVSYPAWLVVDPNNPATLYAGASYGRAMVKSADEGASWRLLRASGHLVFGGLLIDPQDSNRLYALAGLYSWGTFFGVSRSIDGGASWSELPQAGGGLFTMDPATPSTLYVFSPVRAGGPLGLFKSTDRGENWSILSTGVPPSGIASLAIDPATPSTMYLGSQPAGISKSTDGGRTWRLLRAPIPAEALIFSVLASPSTVYAIYRGLRGPTWVLKSADGGETWSVLNPGLPARASGVAMVIDPRTPSTLYVGHTGGVSKSTDGGASWTPANTGRSVVVPHALAAHPVDASILYAWAGDGLFKTMDGGENWARLPALPAGPRYVSSVVIDFARPNTLYALTAVEGCPESDRPLFKSLDGGGTWSNAGSWSGCLGLEGPAVMDPTAPNTLYLPTRRQDSYDELLLEDSLALLRTTDGGVSWDLLPGRACCNVLAVDPINPSTLYGGTAYGLVKSLDGGMTWLNTPMTVGRKYSWDSDSFEYYRVRVLALDPRNPRVLYAAPEDEFGRFWPLVKSTDGGASWRNTGLNGSPSRITALIVDPARPQTLYAGTSEHGILRSTDGGDSWRLFNDGLTDLDILVLALARGASTLYAGTGDGVFAFNLTSISPTPEAIGPFRGRR